MSNQVLKITQKIQTPQGYGASCGNDFQNPLALAPFNDSGIKSLLTREPKKDFYTLESGTTLRGNPKRLARSLVNNAQNTSLDGSELNIFDHGFLKGPNNPLKEVSLAIPVGPRGLMFRLKMMTRINLFQGVNGHVERRRRVDVMSPHEANIHGSAQCIAMELWLDGPESSLFLSRVPGVLHPGAGGGKVLGIRLSPYRKGLRGSARKRRR